MGHLAKSLNGANSDDFADYLGTACGKSGVNTILCCKLCLCHGG